MSADRIETAYELQDVLASVGEIGEPVVVRKGFRIWTLTEDENGDWWAWSWGEEGGDGFPVHAEALDLPLDVIHRPDALTTEAQR